MSVVQRAVFLNPIEPHQLSMLVAPGLETKLDLTFYDGNGRATADLASQLELTGRSNGGPPEYYGVPATDPANGKARAVIPAGALTDVNGYRLNLYGTYMGEPALLATGVVSLLAALGPQAVPADVIDQIDIQMRRGEDALIVIKLWADDAKDQPYDLFQSTVSAVVLGARGGAVLVPFTVTIVATNEVHLSLTQEQVEALPDSCWWSLSISSAAGSTVLAEGSVLVYAPPAMASFSAEWDYQKPDLASPAQGQITHCNFTRNLLEVSRFDASLALVEALGQLLPGDTVTIDVTMWTIVAIAVEPDWFRLMVDPVTQAAVSGTVTVTFARPSP